MPSSEEWGWPDFKHYVLIGSWLLLFMTWILFWRRQSDSRSLQGSVWETSKRNKEEHRSLESCGSPWMDCLSTLCCPLGFLRWRNESNPNSSLSVNKPRHESMVHGKTLLTELGLNHFLVICKTIPPTPTSEETSLSRPVIKNDEARSKKKSYVTNFTRRIFWFKELQSRTWWRLFTKRSINLKTLGWFLRFVPADQHVSSRIFFDFIIYCRKSRKELEEKLQKWTSES